MIAMLRRSNLSPWLNHELIFLFNYMIYLQAIMSPSKEAKQKTPWAWWNGHFLYVCQHFFQIWWTKIKFVFSQANCLLTKIGPESVFMGKTTLSKKGFFIWRWHVDRQRWSDLRMCKSLICFCSCCRDYNERTPLHYAAGRGSLACCQVMVKKYEDCVNDVDKSKVLIRD